MDDPNSVMNLAVSSALVNVVTVLLNVGSVVILIMVLVWIARAIRQATAEQAAEEEAAALEAESKAAKAAAEEATKRQPEDNQSDTGNQ